MATPEVTEAREKLVEFAAMLNDLSAWIPANDIIAVDEEYVITRMQIVTQVADVSFGSGDDTVEPQVKEWPLATAPGTLSRNDNGDALLNEWILAWVAHQLPRAPARLFDANIFYPARDTLAYSEPLIVQGVMTLPIRVLGGSPVLAYNLVLIAGYALTAWAGYLLVRGWTGNGGPPHQDSGDHR